jgi:hypothetical protein
MSIAVDSPTVCHNCGAVLRGRFCADCGQQNRPLDPTLGEVVGEVAREISDLDGRIARSVRHLFFSPGFLTTEHFRGRESGGSHQFASTWSSASFTSRSSR